MKIKKLEDQEKNKSDKDKDKTKNSSDSNLKVLKRRNIFGIVSGVVEFGFGTSSFILLLVIQTTNPASLIFIFVAITFDAKGVADVIISAISMYKIRKAISEQKKIGPDQTKNKEQNISKSER